MAKKASKRNSDGNGRCQIKNYRDVHEIARLTLEGYYNHEITKQRAATIFTGVRTMAITAKIILESSNLGVKRIAGLDIDQDADVIEFKSKEQNQIQGIDG